MRVASDPTMARVLAIANQKGGSGKTTTALNVGAALALCQQQRVLLVDCDPQHTLSDCFQVRQGDVVTLAEVLLDRLPLRAAIRPSGVLAGLDLIPAAPSLDRLDRRGAAFDDPQQVRLLRDLLGALQDDYDFLLLDCPPSLLLGTRMALVASGEFLIPMEALEYPTRTMATMLNMYEDLLVRYNRRLVVRGLVIVRYVGSAANKKQLARLDQIRERAPVLGVVPASNIVGMAEMEHLPLVCYKPLAPVSVAYQRLAESLLAPPPQALDTSPA